MGYCVHPTSEPTAIIQHCVRTSGMAVLQEYWKVQNRWAGWTEALLLVYENVHPNDVRTESCMVCGCAESTAVEGMEWVCCSRCDGWVHYVCDKRKRVCTLIAPWISAIYRFVYITNDNVRGIPRTTITLWLTWTISVLCCGSREAQ